MGGSDDQRVCEHLSRLVVGRVFIPSSELRSDIVNLRAAAFSFTKQIKLSVDLEGVDSEMPEWSAKGWN